MPCRPRRSPRLLAILAMLPLVTACGSAIRTEAARVSQAPAAPAEVSRPAVTPPPQPPADPVVALVAASERAFEQGQLELRQGHVGGARQSFDRALDILIDSPFGGRTEPRIREQFDRLVDRISAAEVQALAEGDGFTEKAYESASIDELLSLSATFDHPDLNRHDLQAAVESDVAMAAHDIPVPLNGRVLAYIELFQGKLHDFLEDGMRRGSRYLPMIQSVFRAEGLPLDLAYVPLIESAFNPNALSRANAKGVWQFMKGTALENGLRHDWYIDERSDPEKATRAAAKYLLTLNKLFGGDWHLALASYNGGPGTLLKAVKAYHTDDFWTLSSKPRALPRETREYVPMILAAVVIARNPAQYGFDFEPEVPMGYDKVLLPRPVDLRRVAEWADSSVTAIQALNPELRRWTTPVRDTQYELKVPAGTGERVQEQLDLASEAEPLASLKWYTVKKGDTLPLIAKNLNVSRTDLAEANYLSLKAARLTPGQKLLVPRESTAIMAARAERPVPATEARALATPPTLMAQSGEGTNRVKLVYEVKKGDTLSSIASIYHTTVASLRTWNRTLGSTLMPGDRLTIFTTKH